MGLNALFIDELIDSSDLWPLLLTSVGKLFGSSSTSGFQNSVEGCAFFFFTNLFVNLFAGQKKGNYLKIYWSIYIYIYIFYLNLPCAGIEWVHGPDLALGRSFSHPCSRCFGAASPPPPMLICLFLHCYLDFLQSLYSTANSYYLQELLFVQYAPFSCLWAVL